ncbi:MAG: penicillin acylase family protein [Verrucomicrobia bacterium]|nr:penicillin acylase family protein [Cytophagales bacterium]
MKIFKAIFFSLVAGFLVFAFNTKFGAIPPFGKLLNPFQGFWANASGKQETGTAELHIAGLQGKVTVLYDDNLVPHIFAENDHDLYLAQGYVTAQHRLWQMEFQVLATAGRISEVVGDRALEFDKYNRRIGLQLGAENALKKAMQDPISKQILEAYTEGVNAYISTLSPKDYPVEYKLLNYKPEKWEPIKCMLLLRSMANTLAGGSDDFYMTNVLKKYGKAITDDLFPSYPAYEDPIVPVGTKWDFTPLEVPKVPKDYLSEYSKNTPEKGNPDIGSNNWAIHGSKSATGYPILAGDPHLNLTLPSIWFQIQLTSPTSNTCGVSIPGAPFVIIGFNEHIAWSETNVDADVMDWYDIEFKNASKSEYKYKNEWKPVKKVVQEIKVLGKPSVFDTIYFTHHGPIVYFENQKAFDDQVPFGRAMRWLALEETDDAVAFYRLNRAKNYDEYVQALSSYSVPAQNFVFASDQNDVAIWANGKFPLKWKNQGKFVLDGNNPAHEWQGWIPHAHNPHVKNPSRGFVSSANQFSADTTYPYYLNWRYAAYDRGTRINRRLAAMQQATPDSLRLLQNDNYSILAENILPTLLKNIDEKALSDKQKKVLEVMKQWNYYHNPQEIAPTIMVTWWNLLTNAVWNDEFGGSEKVPMLFPNRSRTLVMMLKEPNARWFDNVKTPEKETFAGLTNVAFKQTSDSLYKMYGEVSEKWQWTKHKDTEIPHLVPTLRAFARLHVMNGGGAAIVNATTKKNGPSWRMVVALNPDPSKFKAYGLYPGGQSGNPSSKFYDNMIDKWAKGELNELVFLRKVDEKNSRIVNTVIMEK